MGVDYYSCGECGKGFPDVIEYSSCSDCSNLLCDTCRDQRGVGRSLMSAESLEKEEDQDEYDLCPFCSDEIVTTEKLLDFAIEKLRTTLETLTKRYKKAQEMSNEKRIVTVDCKHCEKTFEIECLAINYKDWKKGKEVAQDAFPYLSAEERELLVSGTCDECWKKQGYT